MGVNMDKRVFTGLLLTVLLHGPSISVAEESGRPANLTLESFQFGPINRWAFSHLREVIPTVNIPRDPTHFLVLKNGGDLVTNFSVEFQGRQQSIDHIAE
ncbi:6-aminohexanoate hydrolase, partial [Luminiphilus sp.]|nr:6-aminohexanoate hydrolase [Luminiphilus sp.]